MSSLGSIAANAQGPQTTSFFDAAWSGWCPLLFALAVVGVTLIVVGNKLDTKFESADSFICIVGAIIRFPGVMMVAFALGAGMGLFLNRVM